MTTEIVCNIDTSLTGNPVRYFYWALILIGLIGIAWPVTTGLTMDDWCTQQSQNRQSYAPDDCPEMDPSETNNDFSASVGGGVIMAAVGGGIGMAFLIRCNSAHEWIKKKASNPCSSYQRDGRHSYDLTNIDLQYTTEKTEYGKVYHKFSSDPIKCETCDVTRKVSMTDTMEDSVY